MTQPHLCIGVDCGEQTGLAVYDLSTKKITETLSTDFFGAFRFIKKFSPADAKIIVEVPATFVYARNNFQTDKVRDRMCMSIGGNRREAQLLARGMKLWNFTVIEVLPVRAQKWTAEQLKRYLGVSFRTNQHVRDACRLAYYNSSLRS